MNVFDSFTYLFVMSAQLLGFGLAGFSSSLLVSDTLIEPASTLKHCHYSGQTFFNDLAV